MNCLLYQNLIVENTGNGIAWSLASGGYTLLVNNTIARNGAAGIYADGYDTTAQIVNNVVVGTPALTVGGSGDGELAYACVTSPRLAVCAPCFLKVRVSEKLAEPVADHVFRHKHRVKYLAVMNVKRQTHKIRRDHRAPRSARS